MLRLLTFLLSSLRSPPFSLCCLRLSCIESSFSSSHSLSAVQVACTVAVVGYFVSTSSFFSQLRASALPAVACLVSTLSLQLFSKICQSVSLLPLMFYSPLLLSVVRLCSTRCCLPCLNSSSSVSSSLAAMCAPVLPAGALAWSCLQFQYSLLSSARCCLLAFLIPPLPPLLCLFFSVVRLFC